MPLLSLAPARHRAAILSSRLQQWQRAVLDPPTPPRLEVHNDYRAHCEEKGQPVPELLVKVSKKGSTFFSGGGGGQGGPALESSADIARGERPPGAPSDEEIERLIEERNEARKVANFKKADEVRATLKNLGVVLMDEKGAKGNFNGNEVTKWRFWKP